MCEREPENTFDRYAVAVKKEGTIRTFASKGVAGVFTVFCNREIHSRKCERRAQARGMARTIFRTVMFQVFLVEKIHCRKYFVRLIFLALRNYKNFSTTKISRFTVLQFYTKLHCASQEQCHVCLGSH